MKPISFHIVALFNGPESFYECILFCMGSLRDLGYEVSYADNQLRDGAVNIILGSHTDLSENASWAAMSRQAKDIIIYNWEQVGSDVPHFTPRYIRQMINTHVWDYNVNNVAALKLAGVQDIHYVPLSYTNNMTRISSHEIQDIDVLFYGVVNERRKKTLHAIRAMGLKVVSTEECPWMKGEIRDQYIARSKVVLNMHFFDVAKIFEVVRVSYLLANQKAVVSEVAEGTDIDDDIYQAISHGTHEQLPQLCWDLVHDDSKRRSLEQKGFGIFSQRNAAQTMRQAVDRYITQHKAQLIGNRPSISTSLPTTLNLGAGVQWLHDSCNLDANKDLAPDLLLNLSELLAFDRVFSSWRFGQNTLRKNYFHKIIAKNFFQRVDCFQISLTNCLDLLQEGGTLSITVPFDLSDKAWANVDDKRAFNEKTWEKIVDDWWQYGWKTHRFELISTNFSISNEYGIKVLAENNHDWQVTLKNPRAVDWINIVLRKKILSSKDKKELARTRFLD